MLNPIRLYANILYYFLCLGWKIWCLRVFCAMKTFSYLNANHKSIEEALQHSWIIFNR